MRVWIRIHEYFRRIVQHCKIRHFPHFDSHLWTNWQDVHENFIRDVTLDREVPVKCCKSSGSVSRLWIPELWIKTPDSDQIRLSRDLHCQLLLLLLPSASTSSMMACSSACVGIWPSALINVPSCDICMVPIPCVSNKANTSSIATTSMNGYWRHKGYVGSPCSLHITIIVIIIIIIT